MKKPEELPEVKKKKTNPDRLHMSYDEAVADNRRMKELEARKAALDEEFESESKVEKKPKKKKVIEESEEV